ncbi:MAG: PepSY domain-containing protein [Gammaproteobacteria bacterium]
MGARATLRYHPGMTRLSRPGLALVMLLLALCVATRAARAGEALVEDAGAAARQAAGQTGGRVLDVQKRFIGERAVYVVKVLQKDGRVKLVEIEANPTSPSDFLER